MTVVYIDLLFLLNLIANYLLLLGTGRIAGVVLRRMRIALGAALGGIYAVAIFLPGLQWLSLWPCKLLMGIVLPVAAFGREKRLLRVIVIFFGGSAGLAGLVLATELLGGSVLSIDGGVLYSDFDLRLLLVLFVLCYLVMSVFFRRAGRHGGREVVELRIELQTGILLLTALMDTGHSLTDPVTNRPVVVVDYACAAGHFPVGIDPYQPVEGVKKCKAAGIAGVRLIPYRAVGVDCGMLLAVRAKSVQIKGRNIGALLVALSPNPVDDGGCYQALIGGI